MRLAWVTDVHLDFPSDAVVEGFLQSIRDTGCDAVVATGDLSTAPELDEHLTRLERALERPVYFVLGNHDYYRGSIEGVRAAVTARCRSSQWLRWMPAAGVVRLTDGVALVGHDGWSDARFGDYDHSRVMLNDYHYIRELSGLDPQTRKRRLHALGDESAAALDPLLRDALQRFSRVIVLTHPPPFREACWHEGKVSDDQWLPHFSCKAVGDVLLARAQEFPARRIEVYCGHTHGAGFVAMAPNLAVHTGGAEYDDPRVQRVIDVA